jgi:hypothetical protein
MSPARDAQTRNVAAHDEKQTPAPHLKWDAGVFHSAAKPADKPDSVHTARPKTHRAWQPFL